MQTARAWVRNLLHRTVLSSGFRLVRAKPFERSIRRWELTHEPFFFVQVGAHNGITSDPFHRFLIEGIAWNSVLIEPQTPCVQVLRSVYSDRENLRIVHAAVGPSQSPATTAPKSTVTLYKIRDDAVGLPHWANQLASLRYEVIASHRDRIPDIEKWIVAEEVPSRSLEEIVAESGFPRVDLLASDTEGFDYEVVRQIQNLPSLPQFVYYEHLHLSSEEAAECVDFLHRLGYRTSAVNNGDTFAQRASS